MRGRGSREGQAGCPLQPSASSQPALHSLAPPRSPLVSVGVWVRRGWRGSLSSAPCILTQFNVLFVADLQPSHLGSDLHGKSEAYEHRLLHVHRARALRRRTLGRDFLNMKPDPRTEFENVYPLFEATS